MALNPSIKSPNQIYQNQAIELGESNDNAVVKLDEHSVIKVPPAKKTTGQVVSDRKATGGSSSSTTATPQAKQKTSTTQVEHKSASPQVQPSPTPSKSVTQKTPQPTAAKKTSTAATTTTPQKIAVQQEHNENKKPVAVASLSGCVCKQYDLIWGAKVNCEFRKKVVAIAGELWGEEKKIKMANMLMAVFAWESGQTFATDVPNLRDSGATGLIQIIPDTFKSLTGKNPTLIRSSKYFGKNLKIIKELATMTQVQYLEIVKQYFLSLKGKDVDFVDFYLQVLYPASANRKEHTVFAKETRLLDVSDHKEERVEKFKNNNMDGFYLDSQGNLHKDGVKDGRVMKTEIAAAIEHYRKDGEQVQNKEIHTNCSVKPRNINSHECITGAVKNGFIVDEKIKIYKVPSYNKLPIDKVKAIVLHRTAGGLDKLTHHIDVAALKKPKIPNLRSKYAIGIEVSGYYFNPNGQKVIGNIKTDPQGQWEDVSDAQARSVACLVSYLLKYYNFTLANVTVHEKQCSKTHHEGQNVYDAMLPYLNQHG